VTARWLDRYDVLKVFCVEINRRNHLRLYYFLYTYVQFLFTNHACDKRLCNIVPCIGENW